LTRPRVRLLVVAVLVAGCALPATEEGFKAAFCEADAELEVAITEVLEIQDRDEWVSTTREAMLEYRDDLTRLPAWAPARDAKAALAASVEGVLDLVESGAAGVLIETARWEDAIAAMLEARDALRGVAGPCLRPEAEEAGGGDPA
jgi:ABC-type sugar transport system substrate-binding protein